MPKIREVHELMGNYIAALPADSDPEVYVHVGSGEYVMPSADDYKLYYDDVDEHHGGDALEGDTWNLEDGRLHGDDKDYKFLFVIDAED